MKKLIFAIAMFIFSFNSFAQTSTYVKGYSRSNGTYVNGYYRTTPDCTKNNNYSTIGNLNPYTGSYGTLPGGDNKSHSCSNNIYSTSSYNYTPTYSTPTYYTPTYNAPTYISPTYIAYIYKTY
jgi:hypothetical protein